MGEAFDQMLTQVEYGESEATVFAPHLESEAKFGQRLNTMLDDYIINAIADPSSVDPLDTFIKKWNDEGGAEMKQEVNDWYKSYKSN